MALSSCRRAAAASVAVAVFAAHSAQEEKNGTHRDISRVGLCTLGALRRVLQVAIALWKLHLLIMSWVRVKTSHFYEPQERLAASSRGRKLLTAKTVPSVCSFFASESSRNVEFLMILMDVVADHCQRNLIVVEEHQVTGDRLGHPLRVLGHLLLK